MIEILTASIIGLLALTTFMFVRKLRKPKPVDEIKLQKIHVMRLGPFSGQSNSFKGKSVVFMMLLSTLSYAEVNIITLDNFWIDDVSENELSVAKKAEDINNGTQLEFFIDFELKNPILNGIMKKSFELGLNKIAKAFEERAIKLFK